MDNDPITGDREPKWKKKSGQITEDGGILWVNYGRTKRRFWQYVHDRLEDAWHWVYYHKLARPLPEITLSNVKYGFQYSVSYVNGLGALVGPNLIDLGPDNMTKTPDGASAARYQCSVCGGRAEPCGHWKPAENFDCAGIVRSTENEQEG
jgi:hypothetical protein